MKRILILAIAISTSAALEACLGMSADTRARIEFTGQSNIIIWDEKNQTEHFIRSAKFNSTSKQFDFVAPTPTVPDVGVAKQEAFSDLRLLTMPQLPARGGITGGGFGGGSGGSSPKVEVMQETEVGNFHVVTLKANDTEALKKWFADNQYQVSQTMDTWFRHYIQKGWYLTAFRVISKNAAFKTEAMRMSFKTDTPYNPYYVPRENWSKGAQLELFLVTPKAMRGFVGSMPWWGTLSGQSPLEGRMPGLLAADLGLNKKDIPANSKVFRYVDRSFASGATDDLFFYPK